jgi:hypothetical protein
MDQNRIFRTKPFEKLTSPEKFDELFRVTSSKSWLILIAVFLIILTAVIWGFFGTVITKVNGSGVINHPVEELNSPINGYIDSVYIQAGEIINKGRILMKIMPDNALILNNISSGVHSFHSGNDPKNRKKSDKFNGDQPEYASELMKEVLIRSPFNGTVVEIRSNTGHFVRASETLLCLQNCDVDSFPPVIFFVDAANVVRMNPGMEVQIGLTDAKDEGYFTGRLLDCSRFPASFNRLKNVFHNEAQASRLSGANYYECKAEVILSPGQNRDEISRNSGRICHVEVIIEKRKPFSLLF